MSTSHGKTVKKPESASEEPGCKHRDGKVVARMKLFYCQILVLKDYFIFFKVVSSLVFCTRPRFAVITVVSPNNVKKCFNCLGVKFLFKEPKLKSFCMRRTAVPVLLRY